MSDPDSSTGSLPGPLSRFAAVFHSPGRLFEQLRERPVWFAAAALCAILGAVGAALLPAELLENALRQGLQESGAGADEVPVDTMVAFVRYVAIFGGGLAGFVLPVVVAAVLKLVFAVAFGDDGRFRQYLAVAAHAQIVYFAGGLLLTPLRIAQGDPELVLSVGTFLPFLGEGALRSFFQWLDLFRIWEIALVALGVGKIQPGRSWGGPFAILVVLWLLLAAVFAAIQGALGSLGS